MLIEKRIDLLNPKKAHEINRRYRTIKKQFLDASDEKKRSSWELAKKMYEKYFDEIYDRDIDALSEMAQICSHLDEYTKALEYHQLAREYQKGNPFHYIRLGETLARAEDYKNSLEVFQNLLTNEPDNIKYLSNCAILCFSSCCGTRSIPAKILL